MFTKGAAFSGPDLFNPYAAIKPGHWIKCNFHAHAQGWDGISNNYEVACSVHNAYQSLHYGVHCISNHQNIDTTRSGEPNYISAYEHGYNFTKTHQLVLGSAKVQKLDYIFTQTTENKQNIINRLSNESNFVALNHPDLSSGYTAKDLCSLSGYDAIEVLNSKTISTDLWDTALSVGKKAFIIANDDLHNAVTKDQLGNICTFVNAAENSKKSVLKALKSGQSYGVIIGRNQNPDTVPYLEKLTTSMDSVCILMSQPATHIVLTGQNGKTIQSFKNTNSVKFVLRPAEHYARATFTYANQTRIYLNPVFFTDNFTVCQDKAYENVGQTFQFNADGIFILALWAMMTVKILQIARRRNLVQAPFQ
ncbi:hypothetical protein Dfri01_38370 [Dyadobacter frigoris]|nr:hypothetical protein Dfri01_38370 [Dyadobacter frigoris]